MDEQQYIQSTVVHLEGVLCKSDQYCSIAPLVTAVQGNTDGLSGCVPTR